MSCKFSDSNGICSLYDNEIENPGWNEKGVCICEDDENPGFLCEDYAER